MHVTSTAIGYLAIIGVSYVVAFELQHCFETNPDDAYLLMRCDPEHVVNVTSIIHGVSKIRSCDVTITFDLCREKVTWTNCAGQQTCVYAIGHSYSVKCEGYLTFVHVKYSCLPVPHTTTAATTTLSPTIYVNTEQTTRLPQNQGITDQSRTDIATSTPSVDSDDVPVGAIAGVVVGTVLICAIMLAVAIFCNRRRMNVLQKAEQEQSAPGEDVPTHQSTAVQFNEMVQFQSVPHRHDARLTPEGREVIETSDPALTDTVPSESPDTQTLSISNGTQVTLRTNTVHVMDGVNVVNPHGSMVNIHTSDPRRDVVDSYSHAPESNRDTAPSYSQTPPSYREDTPSYRDTPPSYRDTPSVRLQRIEGSREARDIESDLNYGPDSNV